MEVTRSTFSSALPDMLEAISRATFVSFDGEFAGLSTGGSTITALDSPKMRYHKLKHNRAVDFLLLQVRYHKLKHNQAVDFLLLQVRYHKLKHNRTLDFLLLLVEITQRSTI